MAIINALNNQNGIQFFDTQIDPTVNAPGRGSMVAGPDDTLYLVWAATDGDGSVRTLRFSKSINRGIDWSAPVNITTAYWDDEPSIALLTDAPSSDLGLVFNRDERLGGGFNTFVQNTTYRCTISQKGVITSPIDALTGIAANASSYSLLRLGSFYAISYMAGGTSGGGPEPSFAVIYNATGFITNNWAVYAPNTVLSIPQNTLFRNKVLKLTNGDYMIAAVVATAYDGTDPQILRRGNFRLDILVAFSNDNMQSWGTAQNLTNYGYTPQFNQVYQYGPTDVDIVQLSDNTISIMFCESQLPQVFSSGSSPALPQVSGAVTDTIIHRAHNLYIEATGHLDYVGEGMGFYTINMADASIRRFYQQGPAPVALWDQNCRIMALSTDERYLAIATDTSLELFDTLDPEPNNWTKLASLRASSVPSTHSKVTQVIFIDQTTLFVGWQNSGIDQCFGSLLDMGNIGAGFQDLFSPQGSSLQSFDLKADLYVKNYGVGSATQRVLFFCAAGQMYRINLTDKTNSYVSALPDIQGTAADPPAGRSTRGTMIYDTVNDQFLIDTFVAYHSTNKVMLAKDRGGYFSFSDVTNLDPAQYQSTLVGVSPGQGAILRAFLYTKNDYFFGGGNHFYSFITKSNFGRINTVRSNALQAALSSTFVWNSTPLPTSFLPFSKGYQSTGLAGPGILLNLMGIVQARFFFPLAHRGRLRRGTFTYLPSTLSLAAADFYDGSNIVKLGAAFDGIEYIRQARLSDDTLVLYGGILNLLNGKNPLGAFTASIQSAASKLMVRARIKNTVYRALAAKSHIAGRSTHTLGIRSRIVKGACFRVKANIIPRPANTFTGRALILNRKQVHCPVSFTVDMQQRQVIRASFFADTGYNKGVLFGMGAFIVRRARKRVTAHFIVPALRRAGPLTISLNRTQLLTFGARARIGTP